MKSIAALPFISLLFLSFSSAATEPLTFKTRDGLTLSAFFQAPKSSEPTVIMLHGLGSTKAEWKMLIDRLAPLGWGVLAYDARGHGESAKQPNARPYQEFGPPGPQSSWEKMIDDVGAAVQFLIREKQVDRRSIFVIGASLGANVALNFAVYSPRLRGAVLLSPGLNYQEIKTDQTILKAKNPPTLIVASPADGYAFLSSRQLKQLNPAVTLWSDVKEGHGVGMFDGSLLTRLVQWMKNQP